MVHVPEIVASSEGFGSGSTMMQADRPLSDPTTTAVFSVGPHHLERTPENVMSNLQA
jgi:hypothetical protein